MGLKEHPAGLVESSGLYCVHDNSFGTPLVDPWEDMSSCSATDPLIGALEP